MNEIVKQRATQIASRIDHQKHGFPAIALISLIAGFLPKAAECLHVNDDVSASSAQSRVVAMNGKNPRKLLKRTTRFVLLDAKKRNEELSHDQAESIAQAMIDDAIAQSADEAVSTFGACFNAEA